MSDADTLAGKIPKGLVVESLTGSDPELVSMVKTEFDGLGIKPKNIDKATSASASETERGAVTVDKTADEEKGEEEGAAPPSLHG